MESRLELQNLLEDILGNENVYSNAPSNVSMSYPAIKFEPIGIDVKRANNKRYTSKVRYRITIINRLPNDSIIGKVLDLPMSRFDRHYVYDGLNHDVLELYY